MQYSLKSARLWDHTLLDTANSKLVTIVLLGKDLKNNTKFERQEKRTDKIIAWTKNNIKCKAYIGRMCLDHIQQEFQAVKIDWLTHNL